MYKFKPVGLFTEQLYGKFIIRNTNELKINQTI
mgnify:CR=1 FL=1